MRAIMRRFSVFLAILALAVPAAFGQSDPPADRPAFSLSQDLSGPDPGVLRRRPWFAAAEIVGINVTVWAYDRYIKHEPWAYIGWDTIKANLRRGLEWDRDEFSTNFFGHPLHGGFFYSAARSSGLRFSESAAYTLGGSLMWEFLMENNLASINDLLTTTSGGVFLGEMQYRMSSLVLDERAVGFDRFWRELTAGLIDPGRALNRLFSGEAWRTRAVNSQVRGPIKGVFSFSRHFLAPFEDLTRVDQHPGVEVDFVYGDVKAGPTAYRPFDWLVFSGDLRFGDEKMYGGINAYGLLTGRERIGRKGGRYLTGLFQNFDYLVNEYFKMAGSALTAGVVSTHAPAGKPFIQTSIQLGALFGAGINDHFLIEDRDYTYGFGPVFKVDALMDLGRAGTFSLRFGQYVIFTIAGTVSDRTDSVNWVTAARARYRLGLWNNLGVRAEFGWFRRSTQYEQAQRITRNQLQLGLSAVYDF